MPGTAALFLLFVAFSAYFFTPQLAEIQRSETAHSIELAQAIRVYGGAVAAFHRTNPSFAGQVLDASLNLPVWFNKPPQLSNLVIGGRAFVYYTRSPGTSPYSDGFFSNDSSPRFGIVRNGNVMSPVLGISIATLPSLPDGTLVLEP